MKVHSVKSNAKRAARKIAEAAPEKWEAIEPVATEGGWFPAVRAKLVGLTHDLAVVQAAEPGSDCEPTLVDGVYRHAYDCARAVELGLPRWPAPVEAEGVIIEQADTLDGKVAQTVAMPNGEEVVRIVEAEDAGGGYVEADIIDIPAFLPKRVAVDVKESLAALAASTTKPVEPSKPKPADTPRPPKPTAADIAAAAASLPPRKDSTADEIAARRAERRARIDAEKANGTRDRRGNRVEPAKEKGPTRGTIIVDLASRPGGATVDELMTATGWQRHTLRGYIAGTLRKRGHDLKSIKGKGDEPSRYVIAEAVS